MQKTPTIVPGSLCGAKSKEVRLAIDFVWMIVPD